MKLTSKEICPITVRDRLIKNLANQDIAVSDIVKAVEWAEAKCLELNEENEETNIKANDVVCRLGDDIEVQKKIIDQLNKQIAFLNAESRAEKNWGTSTAQSGKLNR